MVEVKIMAPPSEGPVHALLHSVPLTLQQATADHASPGHSRASLGHSLLGSRLLSPGYWCALDFVCALQESVSQVLCKFWWFYVGVDGELLQVGLCHTQVCCTQSPCPCGRPLLTRISSGDTETQFCELGTIIMPIF